MSRKVNLVLSGSYSDVKIPITFQELLIKYGSDHINIVQDRHNADMEVDISEIDHTVDLVKQCNYTIAAAKEISKTIKRRKRLTKKIMGSSRGKVN